MFVPERQWKPERAGDARVKRLKGSKAVAAGAQFDVSWQVMNRGNASWDDSYQLVHTTQSYGFNRNWVPTDFDASDRIPWTELTDDSDTAAGDSVCISLSLTAPPAPGSYVCTWQLIDGEGLRVGWPFYVRVKVLPDSSDTVEPPSPTAFDFGMNINPDDIHSSPHEDPEMLKELAAAGLKWVRFVVKLHLANDDEAVAAYAGLDERAQMVSKFGRNYHDIISQYVKHGVKVLLVLNQETLEANQWRDYTDSRITLRNYWLPYIRRFGRVTEQIAQALQQYNREQACVAFQIWNEGNVPESQFTYPLLPDFYANLLVTARNGVLKHAPCGDDNQPILSVLPMGLLLGPSLNASLPLLAGFPTYPPVAYVREMVRAAGGKLYHIAGLALHPYHRYARIADRLRFITIATWGTLDDALDLFHDEFEMPLWLTEFGPKLETHEAGTLWYAPEPLVTSYLETTVSHLSAEYTGRVGSLMWFSWSDRMGERWLKSGFVNDTGERKASYDALLETLENAI